MRSTAHCGVYARIYVVANSEYYLGVNVQATLRSCDAPVRIIVPALTGIGCAYGAVRHSVSRPDRRSLELLIAPPASFTGMSSYARGHGVSISSSRFRCTHAGTHLATLIGDDLLT